MRPRSVAMLVLLAASAQAAAADLYAAIDRMRAGETSCAKAAPLPPLTVKPELERAAAALARGGALEGSLEQAGYRSTRASNISISGDAPEAQRLALLQEKYCAVLINAAITDVGVYQDARQWMIVLAAPFAPAVADTPEAAGRKILALVNAARAQARTCGSKPFKAAGPVRWNDTLAGAALVHAEDMARHDFFSHDGHDGSKPAQRVARAGYKYRAVGENIAAGQESPEAAVAGWIKSPPHCANLMNPVFTEMGTAFVVSKTTRLGVYWAQEFGTPLK